MSGFRSVAGLGAIADGYDLLLCDVFGTLHDAEHVFPAALDALDRFRAGGGAVVLVSNAAEPAAHLAARLAGQGIVGGTAGAYDGLVSAGEVTRGILAEREPGGILHLGPARERVLFDGLGLAYDDPEAGLIVCTGYPEDDGDLDAVLDAAARRGARMLCTNPDTSLSLGGRVLRFAGLVAERYRAQGGLVQDIGKPGAPIYAAALAVARAATGRAFPAGRVLGLGDTSALDAGGALAAGFSAALLAPEVTDLPDPPGTGRRYRLPALVW